MANGNPFYISPTGGTGINIGQSLLGLGQAVGQSRQRDEAKEAQQAQQDRQRQIGAELSKVVASGDPAQVSQYLMQNPDVSQQASQTAMNALGAQKQEHQDELRDDMFQILDNPSQAVPILQGRIEKKLQRGEKPTDKELTALGEFRQHPEQALENLKHHASWAFHNEYDAWNKSFDQKKPFEQGTGTMAGYSFNPNTGTYKIDPSTKHDVDYQKQVKQARADKDQELKSLNNDRQRAESLYSDFNKSQKNFYTMQQAYENIDSALKVGKTDPTGTSDIALLYQYNHLLDPNSVVREGEFATAQNSAGMVNGVFNLVQQVKSGKLLTPAQRKSIKAIADDHMKRMQGRYNQEKKWTVSRAKSWGLDPSMVFPKGVDEAGVAGQQAEYPEGSPEAGGTKTVSWSDMQS